MPRKKKPEHSFEPPTLFPLYRHVPLNLQEREELRAFMATPTFQKTLRNAYLLAPSSSVINQSGWNEHSAQVSINRLHQLQGWQMFQAAFFGQAEEKIKVERKPIEESYQPV